MAHTWSLGGVSADDLFEMAAMVEQGGARGGAPRGALAPVLLRDLNEEFLVPLEEVLPPGVVVDTARALQMGSELEQRSIDFYTAMREVVEPGLKAELDRIMLEEETHRRKLEIIRSS